MTILRRWQAGQQLPHAFERLRHQSDKLTLTVLRAPVTTRSRRHAHIGGLLGSRFRVCRLVPVHDFRNYFASLLIASGLDVKVVQARLRHASAKTTLDTYGHLARQGRLLARGRRRGLRCPTRSGRRKEREWTGLRTSCGPVSRLTTLFSFSAVATRCGLLARNWQLGEFRGEDAGSPIADAHPSAGEPSILSMRLLLVLRGLGR
ncbi:MAG: tyrosine-type recombinase/integrase [Actinomycetota bacterium]|nr:tyrosine-type recombinase/integrase [Actinomycetota bacterium]